MDFVLIVSSTAANQMVQSLSQLFVGVAQSSEELVIPLKYQIISSSVKVAIYRHPPKKHQ